MKIEEQVLSREQMAHLAELGIDTSDASMMWYCCNKKWYLQINNELSQGVANIMNRAADLFVPTYTIGEIIEKLPKYFYAKDNPIEMYAINGSGAFAVNYINIAKSCRKDGNIKNALYKSLCWIAEKHKELLEVKK